MPPKTITLPRKYTDAQAEAKYFTRFLTDADYDTLITEDTDGYSTSGEMLFRFRKGAIPVELTKLGYLSFKNSIEWTEGRGAASGYVGKRLRKDGTYSNTNVGKFVWSGNVGYMDNSAMVRYCRKTAFARRYFDEFTEGLPFVQAVDKLYAELCPNHYKIQREIADATNRNYVITDTAFTTVTVNRNFQTAVHKDSGDLPNGFGNLCVYREGNWGGAYFTLPEFGVAIDMQNSDMLFVDVHRWHGNTGFKHFELERGDLRVAFVMYYRENMIKCEQPSQELFRVKMDQGGFLKL